VHGTVREAKIASEPEALVALLCKPRPPGAREGILGQMLAFRHARDDDVYERQHHEDGREHH